MTPTNLVPLVHPTAEVSPRARIGSGVKIWHQAQVREGARIGANCIIGKGAYVDFDVSIGANCKLQNGVYVYHGATLEDGVFLGPAVILANDRAPRAINPDGSPKTDADWQVTPTRIRRGASVGARAVILPGVVIGEYAMVGAGAVVTRSVPDFGLVYGNPARLRGYVCRCGAVLDQRDDAEWQCTTCNERYHFHAGTKTLHALRPVAVNGAVAMASVDGTANTPYVYQMD